MQVSVLEPFAKVVSDHDGQVIDKWTGYLAVYDWLLKPYRDRPVSLLEIGVNNGGSLEVYAKYFDQAKILIGCDIDERCRQLDFADSRIKVVIGDATSTATKAEINALSGSFDLIIDDGSHNSGDIIKGFISYFPLLSDGGIYVVEDLCCSYWQKWDGGLLHENSAISFFKSLVDLVNFEHWGTLDTQVEFLKYKHPRYKIAELKDEIYSIQFFNSMCIITKGRSSLGTRVVAGTFDTVTARAEHGSTIHSDESRNPLSMLRTRSFWPWSK